MGNLTKVSRRLLLGLAHSPTMRAAADRHGLRLGADRFVAGPSSDDAIRVLQALQSRGLAAAVNLLGESILDEAAARAVGSAYGELVAAMAAAAVDAYVSVKPTQIGMTFDQKLALAIAGEIAARAAGYGYFVRFDMEDSPFTTATLDMYRALRRQGHNNVGVVIQAYLYRSAQDIKDLTPLAPNLRLVKGAYNEPPDLAYPDRADVDENFRRLIVQCLTAGLYTAVATHDEAIIDFTRQWVEDQGIGRDQYEIQMLYGIRPGLQQDLARAGHRVRVYVPYGPEWFPYFMRRLAERPANVGFVLKNLLRR